MNTDRRIYLTTAIVAIAIATAITAFARWVPLQATISVSQQQESTQRVVYRQGLQVNPQAQAPGASM